MIRHGDAIFGNDLGMKLRSYVWELLGEKNLNEAVERQANERGIEGM